MGATSRLLGKIMSSTTLGIKVDAELRARIRAAAERVGRTQHWFIKQAIYAFLEEIEAGKLPASLAHLVEAETGALADLEAAGLSLIGKEKVQPFLDFAQSVAPQTVLRSAITSAYRRAEAECMPMLLTLADQGEKNEQVIELARKLVNALRNKRLGSGVDGLIHEYSLSSQEGIALMCLAEALLRIPDKATRDALIRDKVSKGDWQSHMSSGSLFVNAATWGLMITGKLVSTNSERTMSSALTRMIGKGGEPLIRKGVDRAMRLMGEHFVCGETISTALANGRTQVNKGFTYSYDMLGEAAMTDADALKYYAAYEQAIHAIGKSSAGLGIYQGPGISIKLSALHARYSRTQQERVMQELLPRLRALTLLARKYDVGINIDAEEADRLEISLDLLEALCHDPALAGWDGIGFVVQAYQKRAPFVLDYLIDLGRRTKHRLMVRLVKGAYWDTEIKRAQVEGLEGYPVFTRKVHTDVSYLACARKLLEAPDAIFPQFATHNAHTVSAIYHMAGTNYYAGQYEFQCLHGMGEPLYEEVVGAVSAGKLARPCRIYAPVGSHETLLAYLVRRLLENGANSSFVNQVSDESISIEKLIADPVATSLAIHPVGAPHPLIPLPSDLYTHQGIERQNSQGLDLSNEHRLASLSAGLLASASRHWQARPATYAYRGEEDAERVIEVLNPADHRDVVGETVFSNETEVQAALAKAADAAPIWAATPASERANCLIKAANLFEAHMPELMGLAVREAGKSYANAVSEVREAVDFLRYYALEIQQGFESNTHRPLGPVACISPWNFPLAIFTGQVSAALAAGNAVLAKPAEQTPLIAQRAIEFLHEAGVPKEVVQLIPGAGDVGAALVSDNRVQGVMFTGSTETARLIAKSLSKRLNNEGQPIPLVAETGGLNAMIVDSSALPEQVVADVVSSAFDSAGQRCSALRILCVQEDVADTIIPMLRGAMRELTIANPDRLSTDLGPVIDSEAKQNIESHIAEMRQAGFAVEQLELFEQSKYGTYVSPTLIDINQISDVKREVFGPVLHVLRYKRSEVSQLVQQINDTGYGLTFGVHSRIDESIDKLVEQVHAGNLYVNRNIVGAIVGVQPFGGQGLSGTGPKAGGPLYVSRLLAQSPNKSFAVKHDDRALSPLMESYLSWAKQNTSDSVLKSIEAVFANNLHGVVQNLPSPTGETNTYYLLARGYVLCVAQTELGAQLQLASCIATGNKAVLITTENSAWLAEFLGSLTDDITEQVQHSESVEEALQAYPISAALFEGDSDELMGLSRTLIDGLPTIVQPQGRTVSDLEEAKFYKLERLVVERSLSINTAAAGGNATLMAMI